MGIARDDRESLRGKIRQGLNADVLVLSGGVSAGDLDLVPEVLDAAGVIAHFHKIRMKPGKPLFFGTLEAAGLDGALRSCLVFGLPGNPVSSAVCFELFVKPALLRMQGRANLGHRTRPARLAEATRIKGDRPTYFPGVWVEDAAKRACAAGSSVAVGRLGRSAHMRRGSV
ncbi:MAG: molybdopterin-binding protein [Pirellulales bacterium]